MKSFNNVLSVLALAALAVYWSGGRGLFAGEHESLALVYMHADW